PGSPAGVLLPWAGRNCMDRTSKEFLMTRIRCGTFLAPHHPVGEHPTLQFQRDLRLVEHLDKLGFDEFWCGEHHSSGWEMIASPELFLAWQPSAPSVSGFELASFRCPTITRSTSRSASYSSTI